MRGTLRFVLWVACGALARGGLVLALVVMGVGGVGQDDSLREAFKKAVPLVEAPGSPIKFTYPPVAIETGDFNEDGKLDLAVISFDLHILLERGNGEFTEAQSPPCPVSRSLSYVRTALGDFNEDGHLDLAISDMGSGNLFILLGDGHGGFSPAPGSPVAIGGKPMSLVAADFNGDGHLDLAVATWETREIYLLLGDGLGEFTSPTCVSPLVLVNPTSLTAGDFNGDGLVDLAVTELRGRVVVLLGTGHAQFQFKESIQVGAGTNWIAKGDFNEDGHLDLITANKEDGTVTVIFGNGTGGFASRTDLGLEYPTLPAALVTVLPGDFNGDGHLDFAAICSSLVVHLSIRLGDGLGRFTSPINYNLGMFYEVVTVSDFDGDGRSDIAIAGTRKNKDLEDLARILLHKGNGVFGWLVPQGLSSNRFVVEDLNRDGHQDLVLGGLGAVHVLLGNGNGVFALGSFPAVSPLVFDSVRQLLVHDINDDGLLDVVTANAVSKTVSILLGHEEAVLIKPQTYAVEDHPLGVSAGDFNEDGHLDFVVACAQGEVYVLFSSANGGIDRQSRFSVGEAALVEVIVEDFDKDGHLDIAVSTGAENVIHVFLGDGQGEFKPAPGSPLASGKRAWSLAAGDFNGDKQVDLAVGFQGGVEAWIGRGDGAFEKSSTFATEGGSLVTSLVPIDLNGDGLLDLVFSQMRIELQADSQAPGGVWVLLGNELGRFDGPYGLNVQVGFWGVALGDFDEDGRLDMAATAVESTLVLLNALEYLGGTGGELQ